MSTFDPNEFLHQTTTEALIRRPPLPVADYIATITDVTMRPWTSKKPDAKVKSGVAADVKLEIDTASYPDAHSVVGIDKVVIVSGIMLETNGSNSIDWSPGRNGALRRWREALDMNTPGESFNLLALQGRQIRVKIKHREYEGEFYEEVDSVSRP